MKTGDGETHRGFESHSLRHSRHPFGFQQILCTRRVPDALLSKEYYNMERKRRKMAVRLNEDKEIVQTVRDGLKRTGGYCPCRLERTEENKCMCKEFREQIADPEFKGYCHCMLYYKD